MFRMGPMHARDNSLGVSDAETEHTARYQDLLYAQIGIGCHHFHRNRPGAYDTPDRRSGGVGVPVHPTEIPGGLHVESSVLVVQHLYATINTKTILVLISFPHLGVSCSIITDYVHDDRFMKLTMI